jgi:hypothetical protein
LVIIALFLFSTYFSEGISVTNLKKRLDNVISELLIISDMLNKSEGPPPCCLTIQENGEICCESLGPLPKKEFLEECGKCRAEIISFLEHVTTEDKQN